MRYLILSSRLIILLIMSLLWLIAGLGICLVRPRHKNNVYALTTMLTWVQKVIGIKVVLHFDKQDIRAQMPAVLVGLHQGDWDVITMAHLPQPGLVCIGKKSLIFTPIFGILFYLSGNILLDRDHRSKAYETMLKVVAKIKKHHLSIWFFPEGTRSGYGPVGSFKTGALHTAMLAQVKVIPFVTSTYTKQIDLGRWDNGEVHIVMLPSIDGAQLKRSGLNQATNDLRELMISTLQELDKQVRRPIDYQLPPDRYQRMSRPPMYES